MNFEYIGKDGNRSGKFVVRVDGKVMFGEYKSNPNTVEINGTQLITNPCHGTVYSFSNKLLYKESELPNFLVVLRKSYDAIFVEVEDQQEDKYETT